MRLKLRFPDSTEVVTLTGADSTDATVTLQQLLDAFPKDKTGAGENGTAGVTIKAGFPPKPIAMGDKQATLKSLGVSNGEQLVVVVVVATEGTAGSKAASTPAVASSAGSSATFSKTTPSKIVKSPPKGSSAAASASKTRSFGSLNKPASKPTPTPTPSASVSDELVQVKCSSFGYLRLRVMEDDNSCLFRAVGYTILKNLDSMFSLRDIVREAILNDPETYSDAILDKPRGVYMSWIMQDSSWGGAIELEILAKHFGITICSLDVANVRTDMFNPGQDRFVCVVYSGIHYDAVALCPAATDSGRPEDDDTIFEGDLRGMQVLESLTELGKLLQKRNYYTDTAKFTIKCNRCGKALEGEKEAAKHAMATGHTDFGEYK